MQLTNMPDKKVLRMACGGIQNYSHINYDPFPPIQTLPSPILVKIENFVFFVSFLIISFYPRNGGGWVIIPPDLKWTVCCYEGIVLVVLTGESQAAVAVL